VWRYADFTAHPSYSHLLVCVQEDHTDPTPSGVQTRLVVINTDTKVVTTFAEGADFYSAPRFSPNGSTLAWLQWNHPDMPWEGAQLHIAPVTVAESKLGSDADSGDVDIKLGTITRVAGEPGQVAANYPLWSPAGASLHFTCDISGFANPWIWSRDAGARSTIHVPLAEEFGLPAWHLDEMYAASLDEDKTLHVAVRGGRSVLYIIEHGVAQEVTSPYTSVRSVRRVGPGQVVFLGATATASAAVIHATFDLDHDASSSASFPIFKTLYSLSDSASTLQPPTLSSPESLTFDGPSGPVHAVFWPPHNPAYEGSDREGDLPPCVFAAHGGPTHHKDPSMNGEVAFYTSRGWGWVRLFFRSFLRVLVGLR
jgi:dipeptidyl aminopeptidase/acylaminoacyl peptidase